MKPEEQLATHCVANSCWTHIPRPQADSLNFNSWPRLLRKDFRYFCI